MKRRSFLQSLGLASSAAVVDVATASPFGSFDPIPADVVKQQRSADGVAKFQLQLIEQVDGRKVPVLESWGTEELLLRGNIESPKQGDQLVADQVTYTILRCAYMVGVRIFGGTIAGNRPWTAFAWFRDSDCNRGTARVVSGDRLHVNYSISVDVNPMSPENRDKPLRSLITK